MKHCLPLTKPGRFPHIYYFSNESLLNTLETSIGGLHCLMSVLYLCKFTLIYWNTLRHLMNFGVFLSDEEEEKELGGKQYLTLSDILWIFLKFQKSKLQATKYLKFLEKATEKSHKLYLEHCKNLIFQFFSSLNLWWNHNTIYRTLHRKRIFFEGFFCFGLVYTTEIWSFS